MAIGPLTSTTLLLGTAWTGTAPGSSSVPAGTINSGSGTYIDATGYMTSAEFAPSSSLKEATTFASAGFEEQKGGLKIGTLNVSFLNDFATGLLFDKLNTMGLNTMVYFDLKPTSSARGVSNPSEVGAFILNDLKFVSGSVGDIPVLSVSWKTTGYFIALTS
jgi:hypothetical protein